MKTLQKRAISTSLLVPLSTFGQRGDVIVSFLADLHITQWTRPPCITIHRSMAQDSSVSSSFSPKTKVFFCSLGSNNEKCLVEVDAQTYKANKGNKGHTKPSHMWSSNTSVKRNQNACLIVLRVQTSHKKLSLKLVVLQVSSGIVTVMPSTSIS